MTTPYTGAACSCKRGVQRDNCASCEGTGRVIDFRAIHQARYARCAPHPNITPYAEGWYCPDCRFTTTTKPPEPTTTIIIACVECEEPQHITVPIAGLRRRQEGALIQVAFPELPRAEREMFQSRICGACWTKLFTLPDHDQEDDEA